MKNQKKRKIAALALGSFLLMSVAGGCGGKDAAEQEEVVSRVPVDVETVQVQDFDKTITLGGLTAAENTVNVIAKVSGMEQIQAVNVKVGDKVQAGQVLAQLDNETASINMSNAQLAYDNAYTNYENAKQLFELGAVSQSDLNQLKMAYENANNSLRQAQMAMSYATVTAPISGTVTMVNANVGSYATASAPMFEIANVDTLEISTGINEQNVSKIKIGQEVLLKINSVSEQWMSGTITEISKVMNSQTKSYPVTIAMSNKDDALVAGMYAEVQVVVDRAEDVLVIPVDAIVYKEAEPVAFLAQPDGTVKETALTLGINDGDYYVVTKGLKAGDQIVVKGNGNLVEGEAVTIITLDGEEQDLNLKPADDAEENDAETEPAADGEQATAENAE
ncbi:MAG: efflux RND transporter periplasmic adaptor subunit [Peptococcaceae bacterium]|nr:efflux RND transporter periplasmic adaptor subunit [Peptococcaceae bacterium]